MKPPATTLCLLSGALLLLVGCTLHRDTHPPVTPPGGDAATDTKVLEAGAAALQDKGPLAGMDMYLVGFHPLKAQPSEQMEAHHYCRQANEDFAQCVLFDGNDTSANLTGVEYIISERLFQRLPQEERRYWHPHNGEILSGQLVAPGLPRRAEHALMRKKINSYGKTWHTWHTGTPSQPGDRLPLGPPALAWSFNREGEARPGLVEARDRRMGISTEAARQQRRDLVPLARPQQGVDALEGRFGRPTREIPGVTQAPPGATIGAPSNGE